eukprot:2329080-Pyramimonas_sp.AAC.1
MGCRGPQPLTLSRGAAGSARQVWLLRVSEGPWQEAMHLRRLIGGSSRSRSQAQKGRHRGCCHEDDRWGVEHDSGHDGRSTWTAPDGT